MSEPKRKRIVSVFIRLGLHGPHALDHYNKLERIRHSSELLARVFGTKTVVFVNMN